MAEHNVRFNQEADSLNYSMLGPDAAPGTEEFDLFIEEVVKEMTVKAGQKCTAIRRTLVPESMIEDVIRPSRSVGRRAGRRPAVRASEWVRWRAHRRWARSAERRTLREVAERGVRQLRRVRRRRGGPRSRRVFPAAAFY